MYIDDYLDIISAAKIEKYKAECIIKDSLEILKTHIRSVINSNLDGEGIEKGRVSYEYIGATVKVYNYPSIYVIAHFALVDNLNQSKKEAIEEAKKCIRSNENPGYRQFNPAVTIFFEKRISVKNAINPKFKKDIVFFLSE